MTYLIIIISIIVSLQFHPLYNNFTSLLTQHNYLLYFSMIFLWCGLIVKQIFLITNNYKIKRLTIISGSLFIIGTSLAYHPATSDIYSSLHVILSILAIIFLFLIIHLLIEEASFKDSMKANQINLWFHWSLSIIALFLIMFGQINGIVELSVLISVLIVLKRLAEIS